MNSAANSKPVLFDAGIDQGLAWHFGDPLREQTYLAAGQGVVDLSNRQVLAITGSDRGHYLDLLGTAQLGDLSPGQTASTFFLDPSGRILAFMALVVDPSQPVIWGWTEPGQGQWLVNYLNSHRMRLQAQAQSRDDLAVLWSGSNLGLSLFRSGTPNCLGGYEVIIARSELSVVMSWNQPVGMWAYTARRIAAGIARVGVDTDESALPTELGVPSPEVAVGKGCYPGQEVITRTRHRPPRQLVRLNFDGSSEQFLVSGTPLVLVNDPGVEIGVLGSMSYHYQLGPIGLGLIASDIDSQTTVLADGVPATIEPLVLDVQR